MAGSPGRGEAGSGGEFVHPRYRTSTVGQEAGHRADENKQNERNRRGIRLSGKYGAVTHSV